MLILGFGVSGGLNLASSKPSSKDTISPVKNTYQQWRLDHIENLSSNGATQ